MLETFCQVPHNRQSEPTMASGSARNDTRWWYSFSAKADRHRYAEHEANARLFNAAPELYEALESLTSRLDSHFGGPNKSSDWKEQEQARAALAKARGDA